MQPSIELHTNHKAIRAKPHHLNKGIQMNNYPQTEQEIEDAIADGELYQDKLAAQSYEYSGWRDQEDQEYYEQSFKI